MSVWPAKIFAPERRIPTAWIKRWISETTQTCKITDWKSTFERLTILPLKDAIRIANFLSSWLALKWRARRLDLDAASQKLFCNLFGKKFGAAPCLVWFQTVTFEHQHALNWNAPHKAQTKSLTEALKTSIHDSVSTTWNCCIQIRWLWCAQLWSTSRQAPCSTCSHLESSAWTTHVEVSIV